MGTTIGRGIGVALAVAVVVAGCGSEKPGVTAAPATSAGAAPTGPEATAVTMVDLAGHGDFAGATRTFDDTMRAGLPPEKLATTWSQLEATFGAYQSVTSRSSSSKPPFVVVHVVTRFERSSHTLEVAVSPDGKISGFHVVS